MSDIVQMKRYWTEIGSSAKANWHIAHIDDKEAFYESGKRSLAQVFPRGLDEIRSGAFVLDLGCGKGRVARALAMARADIRVFGVDVAPSMIQGAYAENGDVQNLSFSVGDGASLSSFPDELFDYVYSFIVFQHLPRHITAQYVDEAARVLKGGGRLIFQVQQQDKIQEVDPPWNDFRSIRYYTKSQATSLVPPTLKQTTTRGGGHDFFVEATKP